MKERRVLIVDDEKNIRFTLPLALEPLGVETDTASDGEEALTKLGEKEFDLILLDLKMPGIDGIEVLKRVKQTRPEIEVIILTGHGSEQDRATCLELGAFAYLQKPVDIELLTDTLKKANEQMRQNLAARRPA